MHTARMSETSIPANELAVIRNELRTRHALLLIVVADIVESVSRAPVKDDLGMLRARLSFAVHRRRQCIARLVTPVLERSGRVRDVLEAQRYRDELQRLALPALGVWNTQNAGQDFAGYAFAVRELADPVMVLADKEIVALDRGLQYLEEAASCS